MGTILRVCCWNSMSKRIALLREVVRIHQRSFLSNNILFNWTKYNIKKVISFVSIISISISIPIQGPNSKRHPNAKSNYVLLLFHELLLPPQTRPHQAHLHVNDRALPVLAHTLGLTRHIHPLQTLVARKAAISNFLPIHGTDQPARLGADRIRRASLQHHGHR